MQVLLSKTQVNDEFVLLVCFSKWRKWQRTVWVAGGSSLEGVHVICLALNI